MDPCDRVVRERGLLAAVLAGDEQAWRAWYEASFQDLAVFVGWRCAGLPGLGEEASPTAQQIADDVGGDASQPLPKAGALAHE